MWPLYLCGCLACTQMTSQLCFCVSCPSPSNQHHIHTGQHEHGAAYKLIAVHLLFRCSNKAIPDHNRQLNAHIAPWPLNQIKFEIIPRALNTTIVQAKTSKVSISISGYTSRATAWWRGRIQSPTPALGQNSPRFHRSTHISKNT